MWCRRIFFQIVMIISFYFLFSSSAEAASHRLIPENHLDLGNQWAYQIHYTLFDSVTVDWTGTLTTTMDHTENISGYDAVAVQTVTEIPAFVTFTEVDYGYLTPEYLIEVQWESNWEIETVLNNDVLENMPVWVEDTWYEHPVGEGLFSGVSKSDPGDTWTGYHYTDMTFLGEETITVPAGTFDCVVVEYYSYWIDDYDFEGDIYRTLWVNSDIGIIREEADEWEYDADYNEEYYYLYTTELTSTNVEPSVCQDLSTFAAVYGTISPKIPCDIDVDGDVDGSDLWGMAAGFGT